jgi:hypothetical protein
MEDSIFSPKEWQTAEIPSSLNPNSIDQVEDHEMAGWNKKANKKLPAGLPTVGLACSDYQPLTAPGGTSKYLQSLLI